jgi:hypothetical protein
MGAEHDRLRDSWRAIIASGEPLKPVKDAYFTAFHDGGHVKNDDWDAVDAADPRPRIGFLRWRESR